MLSSRPISVHIDADVNSNALNRSTQLRQFPAKTPHRAAQLRKENATHLLTRTGKGKRVGVFPNTPAPSKGTGSNPEFKDAKTTGRFALSVLGDATSNKHNLVKTPFHSKQHTHGKFDDSVVQFTSPPPLFHDRPLSTLLEPPKSALRPSSTRKSFRGRPSHSPGKNFETPAREGRRAHWDVGDISFDDTMSGRLDSKAVEEAIDEVEVSEEDDSEVEYMPPTAIEPDCELMFDMPDYKEVAKVIVALDRLPRGFREDLSFEDSLAPSIGDAGLEKQHWEILPTFNSDDEDDGLLPKRRSPAVAESNPASSTSMTSRTRIPPRTRTAANSSERPATRTSTRLKTALEPKLRAASVAGPQPKPTRDVPLSSGVLRSTRSRSAASNLPPSLPNPSRPSTSASRGTRTGSASILLNKKAVSRTKSRTKDEGDTLQASAALLALPDTEALYDLLNDEFKFET